MLLVDHVLLIDSVSSVVFSVDLSCQSVVCCQSIMCHRAYSLDASYTLDLSFTSGEILSRNYASF